MKSILIIKPSSLGDVVHTLPAVAAIRQAEPKADITWVVNSEWAMLLRGNPDIDHVHLFPRGELRGVSGLGGMWPWLRRTRMLKPDAAVDFQGLLRSALIATISGAKQLYGLSDAREGSRFFYHRVAKVSRRWHAVDRYLKLAECFGAQITRPLRFAIPTGDPLPRLDDDPPFVLLHPFARGKRKSLSVRATREFCTALAPARVVLVGRHTRAFDVPDNCVDLLNQTTLLQLVWLIRHASFVVSVDSGPMHIAAAVTDRLISIHTWSDPRRVGPYNPNAWVWKSGQLIRAGEAMAKTGRWKKQRRFTRGDLPQILPLVQEALPAAYT